jgi:Family of unknown function (DUF6064)
MLPFSREQFSAIFVHYNAGVWPAQLVAALVGVLVVAALARPSRAGGRVIGVGLAAMWAWTGVVYHGLHFSAINPAAPVFAALFVIEGAALFHAAAADRLRPVPTRGRAAWLGWAFVAYAAVAYPMIGVATGHAYAAMPMFGITPCPVTIFTFGVLLLVGASVPWWLWVIPFVWSLIGGSAAFLLGVPQDWLLLLSGVIAVPARITPSGRWWAPR